MTFYKVRLELRSSQHLDKTYDYYTKEIFHSYYDYYYSYFRNVNIINKITIILLLLLSLLLLY